MALPVAAWWSTLGYVVSQGYVFSLMLKTDSEQSAEETKNFLS